MSISKTIKRWNFISVDLKNYGINKSKWIKNFDLFCSEEYE